MGTEFAPVIFMVITDREPAPELETIEHNQILEDADLQELIEAIDWMAIQS